MDLKEKEFLGGAQQEQKHIEGHRSDRSGFDDHPNCPLSPNLVPRLQVSSLQVR